MNIQSVTFHNQEIQVLNHDSKPYVAMRSVVENIGLDWSSQHKRIIRNEILSSSMVMMTTEQISGVQRELLCLPLGMLNGWLFGIEINRVKPEIREVLKLYQLECFDVLYSHFLPSVAAVYPNTINIEQQYEIKKTVNEKSFETGIHYSGIYNMLYDEFRIPRYEELLSKDFNGAIAFIKSIGKVIKTAQDDLFGSRVFVVALMKNGLKRYFELSGAYGVLEKQLFEITEQIKESTNKLCKIKNSIKEISRGSGMIYDGFAEAQTYLFLGKEINKGAKEKAESMFTPLELDL
ncbi:MAG: phage antirepressor N-terminal domain-containing protein [Wohlfahrtiimonas sp.]